MPIGNISFNTDSTKFFTNGVGTTSSQDNTLPSNSEKMDKLDFNKAYELQEKMTSNLSCQWEMMRKLSNLKISHDLKYHLVNGNLELDAPGNVSDSQLVKLSQEVGIIDRIINTKIDEYNALEKKFEKTQFFNAKVKESIKDLKEIHQDRYKNLFEK